MENCTIYSHYPNFEKVVEIVKQELPKAQIEVSNNGNNHSLVATVKGGFFSKGNQLNINYRQRTKLGYQLKQPECALTQNLIGMANFVQNFPTPNNEIKSLLVSKIHTLNCEMPFMAEPAFTKEHISILRKIGTALDTIIFTNPNSHFSQSNSQHFLDAQLNLILDPNGQSNVETVSVKIDDQYFDGTPDYEATPDQEKRKTNSIAFLNSKGIKTTPTLPFVESEETTELRTKKEIIDRIYGLTLYAAYGEGVPKENLMRAAQDKGVSSFTPHEQSILNKEELNDQEKANATWRYESLQALLWAVGKIDNLRYPSEICDVKSIVGAVIGVPRPEFESSCMLRSKAEILDELDKTYRMNWACVNARIKGEQVGGGIHPGIVYERHYAFNWLVNYLGQDWDNVSTDT